MGVCERRIRFEAQLGKRKTPAQNRASDRGTVQHARFHRDAMTSQPDVATSAPQKGPCFVATAVFGEAPETETLRVFRDGVLQRYGIGRAAILTYYRLGPSLARFVLVSKTRRAIARAILKPIVRMIALVMNDRSAAQRQPR